MIYVLIKNGVVADRIVADASFIPLIAEHWDRIVESNTAQIGWLDDGINLTAPSPAPSAPPSVRDLTPVQYLKRFTQAERIAIRAAAASNPAVNDYVQLMNAVTDVVHLDDPDTVAGLNALEAAGLIGTGRAAAIRA